MKPSEGEGGLKGASRGLHLRKASRGFEGSFKGASRGLEGVLKPSALKGFKGAYMRLDMAVFAWGHMMQEQDACGSFGAKLQCWKGRIGKIHIGVSRGPKLFGPRVRDDNRKSPHWACHRHLSRVGLFLLLVCQNRHYILSVCSGFSPCHKGIKGVFQTLLQVCRVYTLRGFISHHVGEPTQCWWATDTDVLTRMY